jgi:hypothetical protein
MDGEGGLPHFHFLLCKGKDLEDWMQRGRITKEQAA